MFFSGNALPTRRVDLRGKSRAEESREQVLERTKVQREQRKRLKLETRSATQIQAAWRAHTGSLRMKAALRQSWLETFGGDSDHLARCLLKNPSSVLRPILAFLDPKRGQDAVALATLCRVLVECFNTSGVAVLLGPGSDSGELPLVVHRCKRLLELCLQTLVVNRTTLRQVLGVGTPTEHDGYALPLLGLLTTLVATNLWARSLPEDQAKSVAQSLVTHLVQNSLFRKVALLLQTANQPPPEAEGYQPDNHNQKQQPSRAEHLTTQLSVRYLELGISGSPMCGLHHLLVVPNLWRSCLSFRPISGLLCQHAVRSLALLDVHQLEQSLLPPQPWHSQRSNGSMPMARGYEMTVAASAILGNILECCSKALACDRTGRFATLLVQVLVHLLALVPLDTILGGDSMDEGLVGVANDNPDALLRLVGIASSSSSHLQRLQWAPGIPLPQGLKAQLLLVASPGTCRLLEELIRQLLSRRTVPAPAQAASTAALPASMDVQYLCMLIWQMLDLPPAQQQVVLMGLAQSAELVPRLWASYLEPLLAGGVGASGGAALGSGGAAGVECPPWMLPLAVCARVLSHFIATSDHRDLAGGAWPLLPSELYSAAAPRSGLIHAAKTCLWAVAWGDLDIRATAGGAGGLAGVLAQLQLTFLEHVGRMLCELYDINCRLPYCPVSAFLAEGLAPERLLAETASGPSGAKGSGTARAWTLLRYAPCMVPFQERVKVFQQEVARDRKAYAHVEALPPAPLRRGVRNMMGEEDEDEDEGSAVSVGAALMGGLAAPSFVTVHRGETLADAFRQLQSTGSAIKGRVRIRFVNQHGVAEAGVDGGGLFKDFMEELLKQGFNPEYALFKATVNNHLYPNPAALRVVEDGAALLEFLGRMLGKAVYEGILLELPLAGFFLKKFRFVNCDLNDLPLLDPEVYRNLVKLRHMSDQVSQLCLTFTALKGDYGENEEVELKRGGRDLAVTPDNVIEYIHRVADYRLNTALAAPTNAFLRGFFEVVRPEWMRMFNEAELAMLISGSDEGLDLDDLRLHVQYAGGYHERHPVITMLWDTLASFSPEEQRAFLKFVTACSRAPLLGFRCLEPPVCVQMAGSVLDEFAGVRLPTSATCMNLLKLPPYRTHAAMREKLLYAITAGAGFDLS